MAYQKVSYTGEGTAALAIADIAAFLIANGWENVDSNFVASGTTTAGNRVVRHTADGWVLVLLQVSNTQVNMMVAEDWVSATRTMVHPAHRPSATGQAYDANGYWPNLVASSTFYNGLFLVSPMHNLYLHTNPNAGEGFFCVMSDSDAKQFFVDRVEPFDPANSTVKNLWAFDGDGSSTGYPQSTQSPGITSSGTTTGTASLSTHGATIVNLNPPDPYTGKRVVRPFFAVPTARAGPIGSGNVQVPYGTLKNMKVVGSGQALLVGDTVTVGSDIYSAFGASALTALLVKRA